MRVRRHQYNSLRTVQQWLRSVLLHSTNGDGGLSPAPQLLRAVCGVAAESPRHVTPALATSAENLFEEVLARTDGIPPSLSHEGPIHWKHVGSLSTLYAGSLLAAWQQRHAAAPYAWPTACPHPTRLMNELWGPADDGRTSFPPATLTATGYLRALLAARDENAGQLTPRRYEAGLLALNLWGCTPPLSTPEAMRRRALIDSYTCCLPDRSHVHELENLPQEMAIGELLADAMAFAGWGVPEAAAVGGSTVDCIVDAGGGNGFLAAQLASRFQCPTFVVDHFTPRHSIDQPNKQWVDTVDRVRPARREGCARVWRVTRRIEQLSWWSEMVVSGRRVADPARSALVAKHLCGTVIDQCLVALDAAGCLPAVLVLCPCCASKGRREHYCNPEYLVNSIRVGGDEEWSALTRRTDWNNSACQCAYEQMGVTSTRGGANHATAAAALHGVLGCVRSEASDLGGGAADVISSPERKRSALRSNRGRKLDTWFACSDDVAVLIQSMLNDGRVRWLRARGYDAVLVEFVPRCVTPKNNAIVAVKATRAGLVY